MSTEIEYETLLKTANALSNEVDEWIKLHQEKCDKINKLFIVIGKLRHELKENGLEEKH